MPKNEFWLTSYLGKD